MHTSDKLRRIIAKLRPEEGYPWGREQTFESPKKCLADETEEVSKAVDNRNVGSPCEGLGGVLLQVVLNNGIASKQGSFIIDGVIDGICRKMVRRHPHVFGDIKISSAEEGTVFWNQIKMQEKAKKPRQIIAKRL